MLQGLNWQRLMPGLEKAAQLRLGLALLAVHKGANGAGDSAYGDWLWRLLEGPVGSALSCCTGGASRRTSDPPEVLPPIDISDDFFPPWPQEILLLQRRGMHGSRRLYVGPNS